MIIVRLSTSESPLLHARSVDQKTVARSDKSYYQTRLRQTIDLKAYWFHCRLQDLNPRNQHIFYELRILSKEEAKKLEIELFEKEILDLKGEIREKAMKSYRSLLKALDKPIYLIRTDE